MLASGFGADDAAFPGVLIGARDAIARLVQGGEGGFVRIHVSGLLGHSAQVGFLGESGLSRDFVPLSEVVLKEGRLRIELVGRQELGVRRNEIAAFEEGPSEGVVSDGADAVHAGLVAHLAARDHDLSLVDGGTRQRQCLFVPQIASGEQHGNPRRASEFAAQAWGGIEDC